MLTADEIRDELIRQIDAGLIKPAQVAVALNIAPARVTEMRKRTRRVQQSEMKPLATLLKMVEETAPLNGLLGSRPVPYLGRVAQGVWVEQDIAADDSRQVIYDRRAGDAGASDLFAVSPEGNSMDRRFPSGCTLICRKVGGTDAAYKSGDYVIVERVAHDLHEYTCKRYEMNDAGDHYLYSESNDPKYAQPWRIGGQGEGEGSDIEIRIIAKVLRAVIDLEQPL